MKTEKTERMRTCSEMRMERTSSIEFEPLTLTLEQLQFAREAAMCILSTRTIEEAMEVFTEGMQPVFGVKKEMDLMDLEYDDGESENVGVLRDLRDIVTAPF
ncbi:uncharacterized protein LOC120262178 [Dioscorea cayenensis subsp. rotundata]|uniref:Uncharacterized protein LOC120262178 n=1 Tax=Dioscorea cayennensis subsp. rotundata TaxID=55577 RepID=A0AB40BFU6_DIOCR|nr:uncharacterized protein LOC120262178 [Dioscorea cayenensis subsp. rotundata]